MMRMSWPTVLVNTAFCISLLLIFIGVTGHWTPKEVIVAGFVVFAANTSGYVEGILISRKEKPEPTCGCQHCN
jgi:hypothetical protein